jgi:HK97 family phage major capsid protein
MKNSVELKQERAGFITEANTMLELCKNETRNFTSEEQVSYDEKMSKIDELKKSIEMIERQEKLNAEIASKVVAPVSNEPKEVRNFSFFKAVNDFTNGKLDGVEREMHEEAVNEARSAGRSINGLGIPSFMLESRADVTQGGSAIAPTNVLGFADAMREASVFDKVGANILTGLSANTTIPVTGASSVEWEGEVADANDGGAQFGKVELTPTRLASYVNISKQLLLQNGAAAEQAIIRDLGRATAQKMDEAIFKTAGAAATAAPLSLGELATSTISQASFSDLASIMLDFVNAEAKIAEVGGLQGNLAYVAHPALMAQLKQSAQVAAVNAGMQGSLINGYPTFFTNGCTKTGSASADFYFGDFSKLYMGMFGGLDIMVDPYSVAVSGQTRLVLNQYMDWGVSDGAGFVKATSLVA